MLVLFNRLCSNSCKKAITKNNCCQEVLSSRSQVTIIIIDKTLNLKNSKLPNMGKNKKQAAGPMKKDKLTPAQKTKIKQENKAKSKGTTNGQERCQKSQS